VFVFFEEIGQFCEEGGFVDFREAVVEVDEVVVAI
jgi:hypothetical protein